MMNLADLLLSRVPQRTGILNVEGGVRVQTFRGSCGPDVARSARRHHAAAALPLAPPRGAGAAVCEPLPRRRAGARCALARRDRPLAATASPRQARRSGPRRALGPLSRMAQAAALHVAGGRYGAALCAGSWLAVGCIGPRSDARVAPARGAERSGGTLLSPAAAVAAAAWRPARGSRRVGIFCSGAPPLPLRVPQAAAAAARRPSRSLLAWLPAPLRLVTRPTPSHTPHTPTPAPAGKKLIETMLDKSTPRKYGLEGVSNEDQAMQLANRLLNFASSATKGGPLFIPAERLKEKVSGHHLYRALPATQHVGQRTFDRSENGRYVWLYKGSQARGGRGVGGGGGGSIKGEAGWLAPLALG